MFRRRWTRFEAFDSQRLPVPPDGGEVLTLRVLSSTTAAIDEEFLVHAGKDKDRSGEPIKDAVFDTEETDWEEGYACGGE